MTHTFRAATLLTALLLLLSWVPRSQALAEETQEYRSGDYRYILREDGTASITKYTGSGGDVAVPETLDGHQVMAIGDGAFSFCKSLASLTLPEGLVSIGDRALHHCDSLTALTLPDSLMEIGANPFTGTPARIELSPDQPRFALIDGVLFDKEEKKLITYPYGKSEKEYSVPKGIRAIGDYAFYNCVSLVSLTLPKGLESIGDIAFYNCISLTSLTLPEGLVSIGDSAFFHCASLTSLTLPEGLVSIGKNAFALCISLTSLTLPEELVSIGDGAFSGCDSLASLTLPEGLVSIGDRAFSFCESLASLTLPDSLVEIGTNPFTGTPARIELSPDQPRYALIDGVLFDKEEKKLITYPYGKSEKEYSVPKGIRTIGDSAFSNCNNLISLTLPEGLESIGESAFSGCKNLTTLTLPKGLESIGDRAFFHCVSLTSLTLLEGLVSIGESAFADCENIQSIIIPASVSAIIKKAFDNCPKLTLTVERDSYATAWAKENGVPYQYSDALDWLND